LAKKIFIVKNATAYTWDWYCHLVVDRASLLFKICSDIFEHISFQSLSFKLNKQDLQKKVKSTTNIPVLNDDFLAPVQVQRGITEAYTYCKPYMFG
jgi:hypothetical protein